MAVTSLVLALVACGGDGAVGPDGAASLHFAAASREILVGESVELGSTLLDARGRPVDAAALDWSSREPGVLSVSGMGVVRGLSAGSAEVVASVGGDSAVMRVVVRRVPVASVTFQAQATTDLFVGDALLLRAVPRDSAGTELLARSVSYASSDTAVATVTADGVLTTVGYGAVVITARSEGRVARLTFQVTARTVASVELVPSALSIEVGKSDRLWVVLRDAQGQQVGQRPRIFLTTDAGVAAVNPEGVVRAIAPGTGEVVVYVEGHMARATISVWEREKVPGAPVAPMPPAVPAPPVASGDGGRYAPTVRLLGTPDDRVTGLLDQAVSRWTAAVARGIADVEVDIEADACFDGQPAVRETVDDLLLYVRVRDVDGPGGVLGRAGPCIVRTESGLPLLGLIELDRADLDRDPRVILDVVTHEMGHVLGIGTLWWYRSLVHDAGGDDPRFLGETALSAYRALGVGDGFVPVESSGGFGTRGVHWRESTFRSELMTGFVDAGVNALSWMSIASLRDLGYSVDPGAAEAYSLPVRGAANMRVVGGSAVKLRDELILPRFTVDRAGRTRRLP